MQNSPFFRFIKLAILAWLAILCLVLFFGLSSSQSAGGEVAMQMFVLTLPISVAVGVTLNAISFSPPLPYGNLHVLLVWLPFFIGGLVQALIIFVAVKLLTHKPLTHHSSGSPSASADLKR